MRNGVDLRVQAEPFSKHYSTAGARLPGYADEAKVESV